MNPKEGYGTVARLELRLDSGLWRRPLVADKLADGQEISSDFIDSDNNTCPFTLSKFYVHSRCQNSTKTSIHTVKIPGSHYTGMDAQSDLKV